MRARKKHTSEPVKSPYGVGCYFDMAVSPTTYLLCFNSFAFGFKQKQSRFHRKDPKTQLSSDTSALNWQTEHGISE